MSYSYADLRAKSDDEIIAEHDAMATSTVVGTKYFLEELSRRSFERATEAALQEARAARKLAVVNMIVAIVSTVIAVTAIVVSVLVA